jgi:hypothetical protein
VVRLEGHGGSHREKQLIAGERIEKKRPVAGAGNRSWGGGQSQWQKEYPIFLKKG